MLIQKLAPTEAERAVCSQVNIYMIAAYISEEDACCFSACFPALILCHCNSSWFLHWVWWFCPCRDTEGFLYFQRRLPAGPLHVSVLSLQQFHHISALVMITGLSLPHKGNTIPPALESARWSLHISMQEQKSYECDCYNFISHS